MRYLTLLIIALLPILSYGQSQYDKKIIITLGDTTNVYQKVINALGSEDFVVKEDGNRNVLTTFPREFKKIPGYAITVAELNGNTIILSESYGLKKQGDIIPYTKMSKSYKPIVYYEIGHGWKLLMQVSNRLSTQITYTK